MNPRTIAIIALSGSMLVLVCIGTISIVFFNGDKRSVRSLLEEELNEKLSFLGGLAAAFRNQVHTDIEVKPDHNGPSLFAHRALLPARSEIFKNMLDSEGCKAAPSNTITLPELNHEELVSLLEFLYSGAATAGQAYEAIMEIKLLQWQPWLE